VNYSEVPPDASLAARVECLWSLEAGPAPAPAPTRVFPDGCIELIVHVGPAWSWQPEGGEFEVQPDAFVVGQLTRPFRLAPAGDGLAMGARLRAAGARAVLGADLDRLRDAVTPLGEFWGEAPARDLVQRLRAAVDAVERVALMNEALLRHADDTHAAHSAIRVAVAMILEKRGDVAIAPLAREAGWSERHFARRFEREVGCLPRQFARTVRFQHLLALLGSDSKVDWAGLAWDSGFADQAHLIREFRRFTGATPGSFETEALALARRFVGCAPPCRFRSIAAPRAPGRFAAPKGDSP
jgi:AraC-like DNA-binding protein